jgi:protein O-GlcNAc transferase
MGRKAAARSRHLQIPQDGEDTAARLCKMANLAINRGDLKAAEEDYVKAIAKGMRDADVFNNLATIYDSLGVREAEGVDLLLQAHHLAPQNTVIKRNLLATLQKRASPLQAARRFREALPFLQLKVQVEPESAPLQRELGYCYAQIGKMGDAIRHYTRAINLNPNHAGYYNDLGLACYELRLLAEAQGAFQQVLNLDPKSEVAYTHLGLLANLAGLTGIAVNFLRRALETNPNCGEAQNNMALFLRDQGELAGCRLHYQEAVRLKPENANIFSGYLLSLNDDPDAEPGWVADEHRRFQQLVGPSTRTLRPRDLDPGRKLRVGYLSPDFKTHSVAFFIASVIESHACDGFEVTCYSTGGLEDELTQRIKAAKVGWRKAYRMSDDDLAEMIDSDGIDILVELSGHTADNRLPMLAKRVAPVQMSYLGYPNTTGLTEMDYRLTDSIADPPGPSDGWHTEKLIRLEGGFLAYRPPTSAKDLSVAEPPAQAGKHVTFGSFNNLAKINDQVLDTWAAILEQVPGSEILMKARGLRDERVQERILRAFAARGIDGAVRVHLMGHERAATDHLKLYGKIDLALDTFPYNGTTTTCEALWMGTPVLTFEGACHAGRVGASLLDHAGLEELVAADRKGYIETAVALGRNPARLAELRKSMRGKIEASSMMDPVRLARALEVAYRTAWQTYCKYQQKNVNG